MLILSPDARAYQVNLDCMLRFDFSSKSEYWSCFKYFVHLRATYSACRDNSVLICGIF